MEYMKVTQAAEQWGISDRRVRILCQQGKIEGVIQKGRSYLIPCNAVKPIDGRTLRHKTVSEQYLPMLSRIDSIKEQLDQRRPLTTGELQRLQEEFLVEYTYNCNRGKYADLTGNCACFRGNYDRSKAAERSFRSRRT